MCAVIAVIYMFLAILICWYICVDVRVVCGFGDFGLVVGFFSSFVSSEKVLLDLVCFCY